MKQLKKSGIFKGSNVEFNPHTIDAWSYGHWLFVTKVKGIVLFNSYRYSPSTGKHQGKVKEAMRSLGINIGLELRFTRLSLDNLKDALQTELTSITDQIDVLKVEISKPRTRKSTNEKRLASIDDLNRHFDKVLELFKEVKNG